MESLIQEDNSPVGKDCPRNSLGRKNGKKLTGLIIRDLEGEDFNIVYQGKLEWFDNPLGDNNLIGANKDVRT
ncbi:MAG: hypothetical protein GWO23_18930 [Gammaproteobacteria bacterium]|nr:hypothetical protein [Gammaproteobacteria bacterium]